MAGRRGRALGDDALADVVLVWCAWQEQLRYGILLWRGQAHPAVLPDHPREEVRWNGHQAASAIACSTEALGLALLHRLVQHSCPCAP